MTARWQRALFAAYVGRQFCECEDGEKHQRRSEGELRSEGVDERRDKCGRQRAKDEIRESMTTLEKPKGEGIEVEERRVEAKYCEV
jgi:hypothetical protein